MTNPATQLSYRLCSLCPVTGDFCSIAFPLLPHLVFYTSENSATVSAVIQGRDSRVIFFSFLSPPKSNKSASLLVPLPERTCSIPTAPLLPPPPHPLMSHSTQQTCPPSMAGFLQSALHAGVRKIFIKHRPQQSSV